MDKRKSMRQPGRVSTPAKKVLPVSDTRSGLATEAADPERAALTQKKATEIAERLSRQHRLEQLSPDSYREWIFCVGIRSSKRTAQDVVLAAAEEEFSYLPTGFDRLAGLRYRFLKTCEAEGVPRSKWPEFGDILLPDPAREVTMPPFVPPPFDVLRDTAEGWRHRADGAWSEYCKYCLAQVRRQIELLNKGSFERLERQLKRRSGGQNAPLDLRLRWAVLHYCSKWSYQKLYLKRNPGSKYKLDAITRATQRILNDLGLRGSK